MAMGRTNMDRATGLIILGELEPEIYDTAKANLKRLAKNDDDFANLSLRLGLTAR